MSNASVTIKMCYVYNQWYDILCATLYNNNHIGPSLSMISLVQAMPWFRCLVTTQPLTMEDQV